MQWIGGGVCAHAEWRAPRGETKGEEAKERGGRCAYVDQGNTRAA